MSFEKLNVDANIVKALKEEGITEPTKIQEMAIPLIIGGKDVIGKSYTGSGKTVAFGVPIIEKTNPGSGLKTLILAPTRELAVQISNELKKFSKYKKCFISVVYGGVGYDLQIEEMAHADIVVATPGRLLDHLQSGNINLSEIDFFVLDEADKMVEMGFIEDIERILSQTPNTRQIVLFGATISGEIEHIQSAHMTDAVIAEADKHVKQELLEQFYYNVPHNQKFSLLVHLLKEENTDRVMIFCSSRSTVELLNHNLRNQGVKSEMIHGKMTQSKRLNVIERLNQDKVKVLVASAVAARGLDIRGVTHVFNYDLSKDPQEYIHRIGRTARAGESGRAITLLSEKDYQTFNYIFDRYQLDIKELDIPAFEKLRFETQTRESGTHHNFRNSGSFHGRSSTGGYRGNSTGGYQGNSNSGKRSNSTSGGYRGNNRSSTSSGTSQPRSRDLTRRSN
jgi:superfamily II DNA/RNA helicase